MIFYWLRLAWLKLVWLVTPPKARDVVRMDQNAPCPACAARNGKLLCIDDGKQILVQHSCEVCKALWYELPVTKVSREQVHAVPSNSTRAVISRSGSAA